MTNQEPAAVDHNKPGADDGEIKAPRNAMWAIIQIIVLLAFFIGAIYLAPRIPACENYFFIKLIYPFIFGALGLILGGSVAIDGPIPFFGSKANLRVAGGVAGAILGYIIAVSAEPKECAPRYALIIKHFPVSGAVQINGTNKLRQYVGRFDTTTTTITTSIERTTRDTRDLKFKFGVADRAKDGFAIDLQFYRTGDAENSERLQFAWACKISAELARLPESGVKRYQLVAAEPLRYEVEFNPNFFEEVEQALKNAGAKSSDVSCLKVKSKLEGNGQDDEYQITAPFYVSRSKNYVDQALWYFVVDKPKDVNPTSVAKQQEVVNGEISVGPQTQTTPSAPAVNKTSSVNAAPRQVAGCSANQAQRDLLDRFMKGDDLESSQRRELYGQWKDIHCYVWPLVKTSADAQERARAIKFSVNAIINNSLESEPTYWQPAGANKRDFSKPLPLMNDSDYRLVFDLVKSDDLSVRAEATRFIRNLPVDRFSSLFAEQVDKQDALGSSQREHLAVAAAFFHYSRIVEWLDKSSEDVAKVSNAVNADFTSARKWLTKGSLGESAKAYEAMLWYAKAIVERERLKTDEAKSSFKQVIDAISKTAAPYPSNPLHLAQAVAITSSDDILKEIKDADVYSSSTPLSYPNPPPAIPLYAGPNERFKRSPPRNLANVGSARMLLRKNDWLFVQSGDQLGWIKREGKTIGQMRTAKQVAAL